MQQVLVLLNHLWEPNPKVKFATKTCDQLMVEKVAQFSKVAQNVVKAVFT